MPLHFNCPNCGQEAIVPDTAINRRARCRSCHSTYTVRQALHRTSTQQASPPQPVTDVGMSRGEKLFLGVGLGVPAVLLLVFLTYWFGIRDTWEADNRSEITARCETVLQAARQSEDQAAAVAYAYLTKFVGARSIENTSLANKLNTVGQAIAPVLERLEVARRKQEREANELAENKRREALAESERQQKQAREAAAARSRHAETYKGFSESELTRLYNEMERKGMSPEEAILTVKAMLDYPDTQAIAREWLRRN